MSDVCNRPTVPVTTKSSSCLSNHLSKIMSTSLFFTMIGQVKGVPLPNGNGRGHGESLRKIDPNFPSGSLGGIIDDYFSATKKADVVAQYGFIPEWDTSDVTDMNQILNKVPITDEDLSKWNTKKVTSMARMFENADQFNGDLSGFDTSNVRYFGAMFRGAVLFVGGSSLSNFDTSQAVDFAQMFYQATKFNADLSHFDTSNVEKMNLMFAASSFNGDLSNSWNVLKVESMTQMFLNNKEFEQKWCNSNWDGKIAPADFKNTKGGMMLCCDSGEYHEIVSESPYIICNSCSKGKYTNNRYESACTDCPKGWYQSDTGKQFCFPCTPGKINSEVGQENCKVCAAGTYMPSAASQAPQCNDCISGQYRPTTEGTSCTSCPAGTYSSVVGSDALSKCGKTCVLVFFFY